MRVIPRRKVCKSFSDKNFITYKECIDIISKMGKVPTCKEAREHYRLRGESK